MRLGPEGGERCLNSLDELHDFLTDFLKSLKVLGATLFHFQEGPQDELKLILRYTSGSL